MRVATFGAKLEKGIELINLRIGQDSRKKIELTKRKNYVGQGSRKVPREIATGDVDCWRGLRQNVPRKMCHRLFKLLKIIFCIALYPLLLSHYQMCSAATYVT